MKPDSLNELSDDELKAVIGRANELLKERDRQRKDKAVEEARAILAGAGLSLKDAAAGKAHKGGNGKPPSYQGGHYYRHPSRPDLAWNAKGQKPGWLRDLEAEGRRAVEVPPEHANDNIPPLVKKAG